MYFIKISYQYKKGETGIAENIVINTREGKEKSQKDNESEPVIIAKISKNNE